LIFAQVIFFIFLPTTVSDTSCSKNVSSSSGLSDVEWGEEQGENCWNELKNDPEGIVWLDIENGGSSYSPPLTNPEAKRHALNIAWAFLQKIDELNHKKNGIYTSVGWLDWFSAWFKDRPLWVAWSPYRQYNTSPVAVVQMVINAGWNCKPLIWQYASDGDVDDDGIADGKTYFGTSEKFMDLNGWTGTDAEYAEMFGAVTTPDDEVIVTHEIKFTSYKVTAWPRLMLRSQPDKKSTILDKIWRGKEVKIFEIVTGDGTQKKGWGHTIDGYLSMDWLKKI